MNKALKEINGKSREELLVEVQNEVTFDYFKDLGIWRHVMNLMLVGALIFF